MAPGTSTDGKPTRSRNRLPGYGWSPRLSGLDRPDQWLGFFLGAVVVLVLIILGGYLLTLFGVW